MSARARACERACVRARARVCVRACLCVCVCARARVSGCAHDGRPGHISALDGGDMTGGGQVYRARRGGDLARQDHEKIRTREAIVNLSPYLARPRPYPPAQQRHSTTFAGGAGDSRRLGVWEYPYKQTAGSVHSWVRTLTVAGPEKVAGSACAARGEGGGERRGRASPWQRRRGVSGGSGRLGGGSEARVCARARVC